MPHEVTGSLRITRSATRGKRTGTTWLWRPSTAWERVGRCWLVWWLGVGEGDDGSLTVGEGQSVDFVARLAVLWWRCWLSTAIDCYCHCLDCRAGFDWSDRCLCWLRKGVCVSAGRDVGSWQCGWCQPGRVVSCTSGCSHGCAAWHKLGVRCGDGGWVNRGESLTSTVMWWV